MASGKRPPSDNQRRRRPPPVINLEATEVQSGPAVSEQSAKPPVESPEPEVAAPKAENPHVPPSPEPSVQPASTSPPHEPPQDPPSVRRFAWLPEELSWAQASAGVAGAVGGLLVVLLLWLVGAFSGGRDPAADLAPRLASIEKQLQDLAGRPMPASVDPKSVDELAARLGKLESAQATPRAPVTDPVVLGRLSAAEQAVKSLADNVAALSRRSEGIDASLREVGGRFDKMASALNDLRDTARAAAAGSDRAARLAAAAAALRSAVERGDPFTAELAVVKPLASDAGAIAALEPFAATGVPSDAMLARELAIAIKPMLQTAGVARSDGGFLERLQANAESLVRVRPIGETGGDDRNAILTRIERRAAQADIAGALAELAKLPPSARAPVQSWIAKAEARKAAHAASRRLAADAVAALKATP